MGYFDFFGTDTPQADNFVDGTATPYDMVSIPYVNSDVSLFTPPSLAPDGVALIDNRSNSSFWNFDQSKISAGLSDVLGSVVKAGSATAIKYAGDSINRNSNQPGSVGTFFQSFQATKTGAQINAASLGNSVMNFLANPLVWLGLVGGIALFVFMRK
mgnify:CR=1 FL=1